MKYLQNKISLSILIVLVLIVVWIVWVWFALGNDAEAISYSSSR